MTLLAIAIHSPLRHTFDYRSETPLSPGTRVIVPFGKQKKVGIVISQKEHSDLPEASLKSIEAVLDNSALIPEELLALLFWASHYYQQALGSVIHSVLPRLLRQGKPLSGKKTPIFEQSLSEKAWQPLLLNEEQQSAVDTLVQQRGFSCTLLQGVTGSGKTEVYLQAIKPILKEGKQVLVLLPEISLTPQTLRRFEEQVSLPLGSYHSQMSAGAQRDTWRQLREGSLQVLIGTRSAVFLPFKQLGCIVVDEEHDLSFKQQSGFRYHARDVAIRRAQMNNIPIILGSATPSLESLHNAGQGRYQHLFLHKAAKQTLSPSWHLLDLRQTQKNGLLAPALQQEIKKRIEAGEQSLLFLNRRGYAPIFLCKSCGWVSNCQRCDQPFTYHQTMQMLRCPHCDQRLRPPQRCPDCQSTALGHVGIGTEKIEEQVKELFPQARVLRIDSDTTQRKGHLEAHLEKVDTGAIDILIGTQMLAKGHDFKNITLVGILNIEGGFFSADFRSIERTGQLILQVAGRAGRTQKRGHICIQTYQPDNPLLQQLIHEGYTAFAHTLLQQRKLAGLPPYTYAALWRAEGKKAEQLMQFLQHLKNAVPNSILCLGPAPAFLAKRAGLQRAQLCLLSPNRRTLHDTLKNLLTLIETQSLSRSLRWSLDVDPMELE